MKRTGRRKPSPNELVSLTIRVHPEARKVLKSTSIMEDMTMEEKGRSIIYRALKLGHLPTVVETAAPSAAPVTHAG